MDHIDFARKGGVARKDALTPEERTAAARHAVQVRWSRVRAAREAAALKLALKLAKRKNGANRKK